MKKKCPLCGFENEEGSNFCKNCNEPLHLQAFCPYCDSWLERRPKRKSKCPICDNYIYVRNDKLFTLDEIIVVDFLKKFEYLGIDKLHFEEEKKFSKKDLRQSHLLMILFGGH